MRQIDADKLPEHKFTRESAKGSDYMRGWNDAIDAIVDNEPTVERPRGKWIGIGGDYRCDKCYGKLWYRSDYCPQCGAYMMKEAEND